MKIYRFAFLLSILIISLNLIGQEKYTVKSKRAIKNYELAVEQYKQRQFDNIVHYINEAIKYDSNFVEAYLLLTDYYKTNNNPKKELECLEKVVQINPDYFKYTYYNYGEALYANGKYEKSKQSLKQFLDQNIGHKSIINKAVKLLSRCENAIGIMANPVDFDPIDLGPGINNSNEQYWPSISLDGNTMIYTVLLPDSTRTNLVGRFAFQEDFYKSIRDNQGWQHGKPLGPPLNTEGNEGAHKLSADGKTIVYTGCNRQGGFGNCDIYFSYKKNGTWSEPVNAGRGINTAFSEKQPALSPDGRILYFSSNRIGGEGGMDLWYSEKFFGTWSEPINMGKLINTEGDEVSPFIHPDNSTFYFSSDGLPGLGMKDIFYVRKDSLNNWSQANNIGYPINSHRDEIGLVVDALGEKAYYATNNNSLSTNIYEFALPDKAKPNPVSYVSGKIYDAETNEPLSGLFQLINLNSADTLMQAEANPDNGSYLVCLPNGFNYGFNVQYPGYLFYSVNFNLQKVYSSMEPFELNIPLMKIKVGEKVVLDNIFFESNSYELSDYSTPELNKVFSFLMNNPKLLIEIGGHTDNRGDKLYNQDLSERRAEAVYQHLISKGISTQQLFYKGYGQDEPIEPNDEEEGRSKNRRTELKIIDKAND